MPPSPSSSSPLPGLLLLLSVTTGLVDAVSVLGLGKVFTANMTGNVVFLGFAAAQTPGFKVAPYLVALLTFFIGAAIAGRIGQGFSKRPLRHWLTIAALIEAALLWIAAVVALNFNVPALKPTVALFAIIALTAIAMGFRNATIRQLKVPDLTTTVLTLTVTGIAADSSIAGGTNPNLARRIAAIVAIFAGAAAGALMVVHMGLALPLFVSGIIVLLGTLLCVRHPAAALPHG
ncbi:YoaK family protein [Sphingobium sp.]|uniref:YoaK family protein n=1 Tax=Sphingobium sp. TaxID=1912891 RepID=UPI002CD1AA6A|nr:YoaK family protein [Sphingobium sp.]HUD92353.1 YoaK family protein [Sphingobium sp.]